MSKTAPWLALAIDFEESEMFDDASDSVQLAWIKLLCYAKAQGRAGRVGFRAEVFARVKRLDVAVVRDLIDRATKAGAIKVDGPAITIRNWRAYQDPRVRDRKNHKDGDDNDLEENGIRFSKTTEKDATRHPVPVTQDPGPRTQDINRNPVPDTRAKRVGSGVYLKVTMQTLRDQTKLREWFDADKVTDKPIVEASEHFWINVRAAAAKCMAAAGKNRIRDPVAVFKWLVIGRRWDHIPDEADDIAASQARDIETIKRKAMA
jgi:hypothetical protein